MINVILIAFFVLLGLSIAVRLLLAIVMLPFRLLDMIDDHRQRKAASEAHARKIARFGKINY